MSAILRTVFAAAVLAAPVSAPAQDAAGPVVDREGLQEVLAGRVEEYADGSLSLRYPFDGPDELEDFEVRGLSAVALRVEGGRLVLESEGDDEREGAWLRLEHLHFGAPFSVRFTMTPRFVASGLTLGLVDTRARGGQTWILLNAPAGSGGDRTFAVFRAVPGAGALPVAGPRTRRLEPRRTVPVDVAVRDGGLTVSLSGRQVLEDPFFTHRSFELVLLPGEAAVELDDLRIHGRVVPASVRKLLLGERAEDSEAGQRLQEGHTAGVEMALARVTEPLSAPVRRAVRSLDPEVRACFVRARKAEGRRDFEDAALWLTEASVLDPAAAIVFWRAGWNLGLAGDHRRARAALEEAVRLDPALAVAWRDLGALLSLLEEDAAALDALERAGGLDPQDALALALRGMVLQGRGRLEEALGLFREAHRIRPDVEAYAALIRGAERLTKPPAWERAFEEETAHYRIRTNVGARFARRVGRRLEIYRRFLEEVVPLPETAGRERSRVWIFDARGQYNVFAGTLMSRTAESTAGVYHPAIRTLLLFDAVDREETFDTLFHEAFHQYLHRVNPAPPIWFDEGMAELLAALDVGDQRVRGIGPRTRRLRELRRVLRRRPERIPDLDALIRMPKVAFYDREEASLHYALAWSLCHFFVTGDDPEARRLFRAYAREVFGGAGRAGAYAATFGAAEGRPAEDFRGRWLRHVRGL